MSKILEEIGQGQGIGLKELARSGLVPRRANCPVSYLRMVGWVVRGVQCLDGTTVKLEAGRIANRWITSRAAFLRFVEAQTELAINGVK